MGTAIGSHDLRSQQAKRALTALPHGGRDAITLRVQCAKSHHVATVYATDLGLVYAAPVRARSHGSFDLPDQPHGGLEPPRWCDLLEVSSPAGDDALPAWCDCGHRTLSRRDILAWIADREHRVIIN
ncbi:MAG: hypothetical protein LH645_13680 [Actinomycetia bacterium]|nr:hypothetical protein [Actinomycetes bacterium]